MGIVGKGPAQRATAIASRYALWLVSVSVALVMGLVAESRLWQSIELRIFDALTVVTSPNARSEHIVIVGIDDQSIRSRGNWPWSRRIHAELIDALKRAGAGVIAFDLIFDRPGDRDGDEAMADAIRRAGSVVLAAGRVEENKAQGHLVRLQVPMPMLLDAKAQVGMITVVEDPDGVVRRFPASPHEFPEEPDIFWGVTLRTWQRLLPELLVDFAPPADAYLRYLGPPETFRYIPYDQVLTLDVEALKQILGSNELRPPLVLVGSFTPDTMDISSGQRDFFPTPTGTPMHGVQIHAMAIENAIRGQAIGTVHPGVRWLLLFGVAFACVATMEGRRLRMVPLVSAVWLALIATVVLVLWRYQMFLPPLALGAVTIGTSIAMVSRRRGPPVDPVVRMLQELPAFQTEVGRRGLLERALGGAEHGRKLLEGLDLGQPAEDAAVRVVRALEEYGCLERRHALALLLTEVGRDAREGLRTELAPLIASHDQRCWCHILHLSDLHFGSQDDATNWHNQLVEDLRRELSCERLDALIVSGDVTQAATNQEFQAAVSFLIQTCVEFGVAPGRLVMVPGNHDLSWDSSKAAYERGAHGRYTADEIEQLGDKAFIDGGDLLVRDELLWCRRFDNYSKHLWMMLTGQAYPQDYGQQFTLHHVAEQGILVVGFNSAWQVDHHFSTRAGIHPLAITNALRAVRTRPEYEECLKVAVWHHPLESSGEDRIADQGFMEQLAKAGFRLALHGHIHKADVRQYRYDLDPQGRRIDIIAAGTFGAPSRDWVPGYPLQYNLLRLGGRRLTVETRRREEPTGAWKPDARWVGQSGADPAPRYSIDL